MSPTLRYPEPELPEGFEPPSAAVQHERARMTHQHPGEHDWTEWCERTFSDRATYHWRTCPCCKGIDGYWTMP